MKKLIFLLLSTLFLQAQTRNEIQVKIDAIATGVPNTALKVRDALNIIANGTAVSYQVIEMDVPTSYITSNFDSTGLGKNERVGWAICNGNNGTRNRMGRVSLAYDPTNYPTLGSVGGSKEYTLTTSQMPNHSHYNGVSDDITNVFVYGGVTSGMPGSASTDLDTGGSSRTYQGRTSAEGLGQPYNVVQPYIVTLYIMKLPTP